MPVGGRISAAIALGLCDHRILNPEPGSCAGSAKNAKRCSPHVLHTLPAAPAYLPVFKIQTLKTNGMVRNLLDARFQINTYSSIKVDRTIHSCWVKIKGLT